MKKLTILALTLILTGSLLTACRNPMNDNATGTDSAPLETVLPTNVDTAPSTHATMPSTQATAPSTAATHPSTEMTEGTNNPTDTSDGTGSTDNSNVARRRRLPRY